MKEHGKLEIITENAIMRKLLVFAAIIATLNAQASTEDITGVTVGISDGDTITVLTGQKEVRVRLAEIDAPEKSQAFGQVSKKSLSALCYHRKTSVKVHEVDRYGRAVGHVICGDVDANRTQIGTGMAWVYDRYVRDRSLYRLQAEARSARRGLWADQTPVAPWEWRRADR